MDKFERTGNRETLGIESRQWNKVAPSKSGWGGYPSGKRRALNIFGALCFVAVWVFLIVLIFRR